MECGLRKRFLVNFCLRKKVHQNRGLVWVFETVIGLRNCKHNNRIEHREFGECKDCKSFLTKSAVCLLNDIEHLSKNNLELLKRYLNSV